MMASQPDAAASDVSSSQKNTIELQAISLNEASRPSSVHSMTAVESAASGIFLVSKFPACRIAMFICDCETFQHCCR